MNLEILSLKDNNLREISEEIGDLESLIKLNFDHNQLTKFPEELCNLTNLELCSAKNNSLEDIP